MSANRWLATGNFFTTYREENRIFLTHIDRLVFWVFLATVFAWPLFMKVSNTYMLVIDNILVAVVAILGLNLVTGFAGLISIGHAAFVGVGAYTIASFSQILGDSHVLITHFWPLMLLVAGGIFVHHLPLLHERLHVLPGLLADLLVGLVVGMAVAGAVALLHRFARK